MAPEVQNDKPMFKPRINVIGVPAQKRITSDVSNDTPPISTPTLSAPKIQQKSPKITTHKEFMNSKAAVLKNILQGKYPPDFAMTPMERQYFEKNAGKLF